MAVALIESRIAACVHIGEGESIYHWKEKVEAEQEYYLTIKTASTLKELVIAHLLQNHPYELPEITCSIVETTDEYGRWVHGQVDAQAERRVSA